MWIAWNRAVTSRPREYSSILLSVELANGTLYVPPSLSSVPPTCTAEFVVRSGACGAGAHITDAGSAAMLLLADVWPLSYH